ncbi:Spastin [Hordeum vulgare]|nr:Spastin [Hordeum vulgare]
MERVKTAQLEEMKRKDAALKEKEATLTQVQAQLAKEREAAQALRGELSRVAQESVIRERDALEEARETDIHFNRKFPSSRFNLSFLLAFSLVLLLTTSHTRGIFPGTWEAVKTDVETSRKERHTVGEEVHTNAGWSMEEIATSVKARLLVLALSLERLQSAAATSFREVIWLSFAMWTNGFFFLLQLIMMLWCYFMVVFTNPGAVPGNWRHAAEEDGMSKDMCLDIALVVKMANLHVAITVLSWFGDAEKLTKALFSFASRLAPVIIFVDEVDSLLGARGGAMEHEATRRMRNEFMAAWDGLRSKDSQRILILGATNRPFDLDDANLCVAVAYRPVHELLEEEKKGSAGSTKTSLRSLKLDDFVQAKAKVSPSVAFDATSMNELRKWNEQYGEGGSRSKSPFGFGT